MNDQLSSALVDVIKAGKAGVVNLALFAQQQAPDLARQVVAWGLWSNLFECGIELLTMYLVYKACRYAVKWEEYGIPFYIIGGILGLVMFICFFNSGEGFVKCLVAPKIYLIEYVKTLMGK